MKTNYDIIGDIHGYGDELVALLEKLGYTQKDGAWHHPDRQALFIGDFIDRGPKQRDVINLIRTMVEAGHAQAIMGNHEFNAIAFYTQREDGTYMRPRSNHNIIQHKEFLNEFARKEDGKDVWGDTIEWFKTLPLWLDLDEVRLIHACWDETHINFIKEKYGSNYLTDELLAKATQKHTEEYEAIEVLLKGKEVDLPEGVFYSDKEGIRRENMRVRWWDDQLTTYKSAYIGPEIPMDTLPDEKIKSSEAWVKYPAEQKPVFIGHYWLNGPLVTLGSNIVCTDFSVAKPGGRLVAYRWSGESVLTEKNFEFVSRG